MPVGVTPLRAQKRMKPPQPQPISSSESPGRSRSES